jgi:OOP family OmpA-OmpF porin
MARRGLIAQRLCALLGAAVVAAGVTSFAGVASAQDKTFSLDRLRMGGAPDDGVAVWRPEMHERERFYGQLGAGFDLNAFRIEHHIQDDGQAQLMSAQSGAPVKAHVMGYADVGVELFDRVGLQFLLPFVPYQSGSPTNSDSVAGADEAVDLQAAAMGDLRIELRGIVFRTDNRLFKLGANANVFAPTGGEFSFAGDRTTGGGAGIAAELDFKDFFFTLNTGAHFRPLATVNDFTVTNEWTWGLGAFIPLRDDRIRLGVEIFGSTGIGEGTTFKAENTPLEWMAEARFALTDDKQLYAGGHGGTRMTPGYAPDFRLGGVIGYWFEISDVDPPSPANKPKQLADGPVGDADKDGFPDDIDLCPTDPEDGKAPDPTDGCPNTDRDGDGIPDSRDKCPDEPEDFDKVDDRDGCPEDDADKDNIPDAKDACPKEPGPENADPKKNGCPQFIRRVEGSSEIEILQQVQFETGSARIKQESFGILDEVVALLKANPDIALLSIEGHTDNRGSDQLNDKLSKDRAKSCLDYLVQKGIAKNRLASDGFGPTKPIADNNTPDGRQKNRRTEFKIKEGGTGAPPVQKPGERPTPSGTPVPGE